MNSESAQESEERRVGVTLPTDLHFTLVLQAVRADRSLNRHILRVLRQATQDEPPPTDEERRLVEARLKQRAE